METGCIPTKWWQRTLTLPTKSWWQRYDGIPINPPKTLDISEDIRRLRGGCQWLSASTLILRECVMQIK